MHDRIGFSFASALGAAVPVFCAVAVAVIANMPISFSGGLLPAPLLSLMPVYFWCLVRPDLMPPWAVLLIGLLEDLLSGGAPGVWAASFVVAYALVDRQRDSFAGLAGIGAILGFALALFAACATAYLIATLTHWHAQPVGGLIVEFGVTTLYYIPGIAFLGFLHRHFVGPLRSGV
jgi:rod shape-determining protein MreD